jgi:hypothetical protein
VDPKVLLARVDRLWSVLDNLVGVRLGRLPRAVERPNEHYMGAIASGLPETALKMVEKKKGDDKSVSLDATSADVLRLLLWVGRAEAANAYFADELKTMEDVPDMPAERRAVERAKFRMVEYELAKLNGDYARADVLFEEVLSTPLSDLGAGRPADSLLFGDQWLAPAYRPLADAEKKLLLAGSDLITSGAAVGGWPAEVFANAVYASLRDRLLFQAFTRYQRGVFALLVGDVTRAKEHFDAAVAPQGVPLEKVGLPLSLYPPLGQLLPKYRELLTKYAANK